MRRLLLRFLLAMSIITCTGCFAQRPSAGGGQTKAAPARPAAVADDVVLPPGYRIERVAEHLNFPTGVTFDDAGTPYVIEAGYVYGEVWTTPRLLRIEADGRATEIASGDHAPWTGVVWRAGAFYVSQGGEKEGGRIVRIEPGGKLDVLIDKLPSVGDHHTNQLVIGTDGFLYFGQGTATNSGIVGGDNAKFGWLARHPDFHDVPAKDVKLVGRDYTTPDVRSGGSRSQKVRTGAFMPFGTPTSAGQVVRGQLPASGTIMKIPIAGGAVQLVAWGLRNPFGIALAPDGVLWCTENSFDVRGSRPVWGTGDLLWKIEPGMWYGWPDFFAGEPLDEADRFQAPGREKPARLLAEVPNAPPKPAAYFGVHSSSNGFAFAPDSFGYAGEAFVAQFGDMSPGVGKVMAPVGFKVVRVDPNSGVIHDFAANRGKTNGPASKLRTRGFERPTDLKFDAQGRMYIVDFGVMTVDQKGPHPKQNTGVLWRVTREEAAR
jgi:glucose/arabinose dehydrogenase